MRMKLTAFVLETNISPRNRHFQGQRCFEDFSHRFSHFQRINDAGKPSPTFAYAKNEIWPWLSIFKVKDTSVIFFSIFFVFSASNHVGKQQQCFEEFKNYFLHIKNIKFCLKALNILSPLSGRYIDHPRN